MEISTPRQLLRSLGPLPETAPPRPSAKSLQELYQSQDWLEDSLNLQFVTIFRADFWGGDATKHFSVKKRGFQWKGGRQFSELGVW